VRSGGLAIGDEIEGPASNSIGSTSIRAA